MSNTLKPVRIAHISDTHLGYEAYPATATNAMNQRGTDIVRALDNVVKDILADDPPLVIHSGDVFDKSTVPVRYLLEVRRQLQRLASKRADGSRRQVVVIAGNHDQPYSRMDPCHLELFNGIPGVHIVTTHYRIIDFKAAVAEGEAPTELAQVAVHAIPHDDLKTLNFDEVQPVEGYVNILTAHGVAGGSDLFVRALGREYPIPTDVLSREWDYVALGHWHKQGPVGLRTSSKDAEPASKVWYAGSPENISFRDLRDNGTKRGYLKVEVRPGHMPSVQRVNLPIRTMFRLPVIDATGLGPEQIAAALKKNLAEADIANAVVGQIVEGVTQDVWALVDLISVRAAASAALHYEGPTPRYNASKRDDGQSAAGPTLGDLGSKLAERAQALLRAEDREAALDLARQLLGDALSEAPEDDDDTPALKPARRVNGGSGAVAEPPTSPEAADVAAPAPAA